MSNRLPTGWTKARVSELVDLVNGYAFKPSDWETDGLPIIRIQNLNNATAPYNHSSKNLPEKFLVKTGALLFAWSGTPGTSFGAHIWRGQTAWLNQHIFKVRFNERHLNKRFLRLAINHNLGEYIAAAHGAAGLAHITKGKFDSSELLLPPLAEQLRIIEEIEKQFTRLDAAVAALRRVQAQLKRYRASILKAACEGTLVPTEAELAHTDGRDYESAERLLSRGSFESTVKGKRRAGRLWGAGVVPSLTIEERLRISEGWAWAKVRELGQNTEEVVQVGPMSMRSKDFENEGTPVLNVGCIGWGTFNENKLDYLPSGKAAGFSRYRIQAGDVLFTRSGTVGRCAVAKPHQEGWLMTFHLLRVRTDRHKCLPEYLRIVFEGGGHIRRQTREASIGTTRAGFNTNLLATLDVPLPPLAEQQRIIAEVDRRLSIVDEIKSMVDANLKRATALRQSILKRAFEGKLVSQDLNDEPASVLLERIRAERASKAAETEFAKPSRKMKVKKHDKKAALFS